MRANLLQADWHHKKALIGSGKSPKSSKRQHDPSITSDKGEKAQNVTNPTSSLSYSTLYNQINQLTDKDEADKLRKLVSEIKNKNSSGGNNNNYKNKFKKRSNKEKNTVSKCRKLAGKGKQAMRSSEVDNTHQSNEPKGNKTHHDDDDVQFIDTTMSFLWEVDSDN